uniref:DUF4806 domain-containing protein n=1 Tax=Schizaphis graminum TaxID=13262 RepID=A0A2S2NHT5_SCHGA
MSQSQETKLWSIVEFDDGSIQIIPKNWFLNDSKCYWPTQGTFKSINAYTKAVKKMAIPDEKWPIFDTQILASYDDFDVAFKKLKKAETHTDLATDAEQEKLSRNLRHKKRKKSSSSSSDEDKTSKLTIVKVPAVPKPPSSGNNTSADRDQIKLTSKTEHLPEKNRSSVNKSVSYDYKEHFQSQIYDEPSKGHQTNSKKGCRSLSYNNSESSTDYETDSKHSQPSASCEPSIGHSASHSKRFHPSKSYDDEPFSGHRVTNSKKVCRSLSYNSGSPTDYEIDPKHSQPSASCEPSIGHSASHSKRPSKSYDNESSSASHPVINSRNSHLSTSFNELHSNNHPSNSQNSFSSSRYNVNLTDSNISLFQKGNKRVKQCLSNNDFQDRVLRQLSHIKLHLFKLDEKLSAVKYPSQENINLNDTYDTNILEIFPLQYEQDLQNVEIKLKKDEIYKSSMLTALSKMGGSKTDEATKYILKKIYSDKLAMCYSWMGGKGKKVLSTMILPKIIIEVVQKRINNCTEIDVVNSIKNWLRHANQRNLNRLKAAEKRSLDQNKEDE